MKRTMIRGFVAGCVLAIVGTASADYLFGPGPHWVDTVTEGFDQRPSNLQISLFLGDPFDPLTEKVFIDFFGKTTIFRSNAMDDSNFFPGLRPVDGHLDVIDVEIVALELTGISPFGPVTIRAPSGISHGITRVNTLPTSTSLFTVSFPPKSSASRLEIARPSPVPPYLRVWDEST